ncbi:TPA: hypothetical protein ENS27_14610 [bacterium]|nr:hypothetical protein [bacterium]
MHPENPDESPCSDEHLMKVLGKINKYKYLVTGLMTLAPISIVNSSLSWNEEPLAWGCKRLPFDIIIFILEQGIDSLEEVLDSLGILFVFLLSEMDLSNVVSYAIENNLDYATEAPEYNDHILDFNRLPNQEDEMIAYKKKHLKALINGLKAYAKAMDKHKSGNYQWDKNNIDGPTSEFAAHREIFDGTNWSMGYTCTMFFTERDKALKYPSIPAIVKKVEEVAIETKCPKVYSVLACLYILANRSKSAINIYKRMKSMQAYDHYNYGTLLLTLKENELARAEFMKALELDDNMDEAQYNLGITYMYEYKWEDAIKQFAKFITNGFGIEDDLYVIEDEPSKSEMGFFFGRHRFTKADLRRTIMYFSANNTSICHYYNTDKVSKNLMSILSLLFSASANEINLGRIEARFNAMEIIKMLSEIINENMVSGKIKTIIFPDTIIGSSYPMYLVYKQIQQVANSDINVFITGETGTGKELVAQAIHDNSSRKEGEHRIINCTTIPKDLLEVELFGYEKGAFTEAIERKIGLFEVTSDGTLFLDEIGEISLEAQAKLLRAIEYKEIRRLGSTEPIKVNTRLIMATNRDLKKEVEAGRFREDLYYRINVFNINLPPLRERKEDIPLLIDHFIEIVSNRMNKRFTLTEPVIEILNNYSWSGNVRQLKNAIESAANRTDGDIIHSWDLPEDILKDFTINENTEEMRIIEAYKATNGNALKSANKLGMPRSTFYSKVNQYGINLDAIKAEIKNK